MELLAGSLNVEVDEFLHAGYISGQPRSFAMAGSYGLERATLEVIDVKKALTLKAPADEAEQVAETSTAEALSPAPPLVPASIRSRDSYCLTVVFFFFLYLAVQYGRRIAKARQRPGWRPWLLPIVPTLILLGLVSPTSVSFKASFALAAVFFLLACLVGQYYRRIRKVDLPAWRPWLLVGVPMLLVVNLWYDMAPKYQEMRLNSLPPPWRGVPIRQYEDPQAATQAILQGLVVNALPGCPVKMTNLAAIQGEVAFPVPRKQYTPGMTYAVKTYGRDGWGREFLLKPLPSGQYEIASAGADGQHGTSDDILLTTPAGDPDRWEERVNGLYVRRVNGEYALFVHRVDHHFYDPANVEEARGATGTDLFDLIRFSELFWNRGVEDEPHPLIAGLESFPGYLRPDGKTEPLLFVQIEDIDDG